MSKAKIDDSKCQGCGHCATVCPAHAIHKNEVGISVVDLSLCTGCGRCSAECPINAIGPADPQEK